MSFKRRPSWQVILAVVFLSQLFTAVGFSIVFPFLPLYVQHLGSTTGMSVELAAGLVVSSQAFTMMLTAPIWGVVADRYGRKLMVMRAMFGGTIIMALMGLAGSAEQLILLRAIQGLITGTTAANNALVAAEVPRDRIGFAMGTLQMGLWSGVAAGPIIGGFLADAFGFAMPFFITAVLLGLSGFLVLFGVHEDHRPEKRKSDAPGFVEQWRHVLIAPGVPFLYVMQFLSGAGRSIIIPIAPLFVVSLLPQNAASQSIYAGLVIAISSGAGTISAVYLGRLGDRIGHRYVLIGSALVAALFYFPQFLVMEVWQLLALQGITGLAAGGLIAAPAALLARYTDHGEEGAVYGLENAISSGARAVAPMIGSTLAILLGLRGTFAATGFVFLLIAFIAYRYLQRPQTVEQRMVSISGD